MEKVLRVGQTVAINDDAILVSGHGVERQIADSAAPIRDENGSIIGVIVVFRDVSEEGTSGDRIPQLPRPAHGAA